MTKTNQFGNIFAVAFERSDARKIKKYFKKIIKKVLTLEIVYDIINCVAFEKKRHQITSKEVEKNLEKKLKNLLTKISKFGILLMHLV